MSWLWAAIARIAAAIWDRVRAEINARARGRAEAERDALREAQRLEAEGRQAADEGRRQPPEIDDGFRRD